MTTRALLLVYNIFVMLSRAAFSLKIIRPVGIIRLQNPSMPLVARYMTTESNMQNLYQEWSRDQDRLLWEHRNEPIHELASKLGRGLRGVEERLKKLKNVDSTAYQRLFVSARNKNAADEDLDNDKKKKEKLVPVSEVLRRIQWDHSIPADKFTIVHYDRVDDTVVESPVLAPNESISGKGRLLIDALPEHRILMVKYQERIVWDRENRIDRVFGRDGIHNVIAEYEDWKKRRDEAIAWNKQRQMELSLRIERILGAERYARFQQLSEHLQAAAKDPAVSLKMECEVYVSSVLELFRQIRGEPEASPQPDLIPTNDYDALDILSELMALVPDSSLRPLALNEISFAMSKAEGKKVQPKLSVDGTLPELREEDIVETFVRGSGPGGQKINKTSNRVVLLHEPTQIRVECQDTRSLQQNRKIARKRLQLKLDEYLNGSQSRASLKAQQAASKKAKAKARARTRQRKKKEAKDGEEEALA